MVLIKLDDGTIVKLTNEQAKEFNNTGIVRVTDKYSKEFYKDKIIKVLTNHESMTAGKIYNNIRGKNRIEFDAAIGELVIENKVKRIIYDHAVNETKIFVLSLI